MKKLLAIAIGLVALAGTVGCGEEEEQVASPEEAAELFQQWQAAEGKLVTEVECASILEQSYNCKAVRDIAGGEGNVYGHVSLDGEVREALVPLELPPE